MIDNSVGNIKVLGLLETWISIVGIITILILWHMSVITGRIAVGFIDVFTLMYFIGFIIIAIIVPTKEDSYSNVLYVK